MKTEMIAHHRVTNITLEKKKILIYMYANQGESRTLKKKHHELMNFVSAELRWTLMSNDFRHGGAEEHRWQQKVKKKHLEKAGDIGNSVDRKKRKKEEHAIELGT